MAGTTGMGPSSFSTTFTTPGHGFNPNQVSTPYQSIGQSVTMQNASAYPGLATGSPEVFFSGKHNGLCLYLGRILRLVFALGRIISNHSCCLSILPKTYVTDVTYCNPSRSRIGPLGINTVTQSVP